MSEMMYRLTLRAHFEGEAELERVLHGLERLEIQGATVNVRVGEMGRTGALGLDSIARSALRCGYMLNMLESAWMRQTMAQMMATNAQERYNTVVERYGANSEEARQAAKQLEMQTNYLNMANMRANVSMGLMVMQLALQSGLLEKATIRQIAKTVAQAADTIGGWAHNAMLAAKAKLLAMVTMGAAVPLMLAGAAVVTMATAAATRPRAEINIEGAEIEIHSDEEVDEALNKYSSKVKQELRRARGD